MWLFSWRPNIYWLKAFDLNKLNFSLNFYNESANYNGKDCLAHLSTPWVWCRSLVGTFSDNGTARVEIRKLKISFAHCVIWHVEIPSTQTWWSGTEDDCIENIKLKDIKISTGCQYATHLYDRVNLKLDRTKPSTGPHAVRGPRVEKWK